MQDGGAVDDAALAACLGWLSAPESVRYHRFVRPLRQRQFLLGRALLRRTLGQLLSLPPESIALTERDGLSPLLDYPGSTIGFSLSHSGSWVACAICAQSPLGLDIEMLDAQRDLSALAQQAFDVSERNWFAAQPAGARVAAFYYLWSRREARIKLASNSGSTQPGFQFVLPHGSVSVVLCSAVAVDAHLVNDAFHSVP